MDKDFNLKLPTLRLYHLTKNIAAEIAPHISSALRDLGVIFEKSLLSSSTKLVDAYPEGALDSWSGTKNEQKNTENNVIEGETRILST